MITFDSFPAVYWLLGYLLAGIVILSGHYKSVPIKAYLILGLLLLLVMRLPVIVFNRELNPDESQMLSHAITLFQDPVYWRSVDGTTIGPLDNYLLVLPKLFGFQIDYTSGRFMGFLCAAGSLVFLFFTLKNWFGVSLAKKVFLVPLIFLAFIQEVDFVHYSSEQFPVFLLSLCLWLLSCLGQHEKSKSANAYFVGFVAGAIPFAKLQAVPQAMVMVLAACWFCYIIIRDRKDYRPFLALMSGGLTFPVIVLLWTLAFHVFTDLIDFYLLGNVVYAEGKGFFSIPAQFAAIFRLTPDFQFYTWVLIVPMLLGLIKIFSPSKIKTQDYTIPLTILFLVLSSIYAATKSGNYFIHYFNFCIAPWTLLAAYGLSKLEKWSLVFPALLLVWFVGNDAYSFVKERKLNEFASVGARDLWNSPVVKELKKYSKPGDFMVVWGWQCVYYVEAQLAQGTAENHTERSIFDLPVRQTYRDRYLSDMERNKPAIVLDAVGKNSFWVQNKKTQGIESYPELYQYILKNYELLGSFDDTRLYVRKDRLQLR